MTTTKRYAFTPIVVAGKGYIIGRADEGERGYTPQPQRGTFATLKEAREAADALNAEAGLDKLEAWAIVASTM